MRLFRKRFPAVELRIRELLTYQQIQELMGKHLDLGYVGLRFAELEKELEFECVRRGALWVALPPGHRLAKQKHVPLRSLAKEPFVAPPRTAPAYRDALLNFCRSAGFIPDVVQEGNNAQCMLELVSAGVGVALVPDTFQRLLAIEVEFRPLAPNPPHLESHIAWHRDNPSPSLRAFLGILHEQVKSEPGMKPRSGGFASTGRGKMR